MKDELLGKQLASYQLVQLLGQGAFGSVYLGKHFLLTQKPPVAIKVLNTALNSQEEFDRFFQEAVILDTLSHPNILPVLDANLYEGYPFFVAEYAPGGSLRDRLDDLQGQPLPQDEAVEILQQVGRGLQHAHDLDVVHRDLKPANILFHASGEAMLADFGISLQIQKTKRVDEIGTPAYMSPEQFKGKISKKSDQYALGCIAYELFTGQQLFTADDPYTIGYKHIYEEPVEPHQLNPEISPAIESVLLKALAKERDDRYESVAEFVQALQEASLRSLPTSQRTATRDTRQPKKRIGVETTSAQVIETNPPIRGHKNTTRPEQHAPLPKFLQNRSTNQTSQKAHKSITQLLALWSTNTHIEHISYAEPIVSKGIVYAGTYNTVNWSTAGVRHLRALDAASGEHLWSYKTNSGIYEAPIVVDGILYFCSGNVDNGGKICALDADSGELYWTFETDEHLSAAPISYNDMIYAHSEHAVYALNSATGQQYWNVTLKAPLHGRPMIVNNIVYIATERGHCYAVDAERGQKLATYADVGQVYTAFARQENIICICAYDNSLYALDMTTGETYWSIPLESQIDHDMEVVNGIAYISTQGDFGNSSARTKLFAIDLTTGKQQWVAYLRNEIDATPVVADGLVYLTTKGQELYILEAQQGKLLYSKKIGGEKISRPYVTNDAVFINTSEINAFKLT